MRCEIRAEVAEGLAWRGIVCTCAADLRLPIEVTLRRDCGDAGSLTLIVPVETVLFSHDAWNLAGRLACFCAGARVNVLVQSGGGHARASFAAAREWDAA